MNEQLGPVQKQWIAALRSGKYQQGYYRLRNVNDRYCCLGVLCDIIDHEGWNQDWPDDDFKHMGSDESLPAKEILVAAGIWTDDIDDSDTLEMARMRHAPAELASLNDEKHLTFDEIADYLEGDPRDWFVESL